MKKSAILLSFLLLILTACGADPKPVETIRVVEEEEIRKGMYQEVEYLERMPQVTQIAPFMPENAISGCFCANGDTVFYLAYFGDYLLDQETGNNKEFEPQYNTQIWAYDKESGSCALIYQYDEDWCVEISDMVCDESTLVWEDYGDEGWRLQAMPLDGSASPEIIISKADMNSDIWSVTPAGYDIETKTYTELAAVDENGTLMYTFQDSESRVSLEMSLEQDDFQVLEIFYDSEQN